MNVNQLILEMRVPDEVTPEFIALHERIEAAVKDGTITDELLQQCKEDECIFCGVAVCRYHEPLHFHHDGCPACWRDE